MKVKLTFEYDAVQFTGNNFEELKDFFRGEGKFVIEYRSTATSAEHSSSGDWMFFLVFGDPPVEIVVNVGEYVVRDVAGTTLFVVSADRVIFPRLEKGEACVEFRNKVHRFDTCE